MGKNVAGGGGESGRTRWQWNRKELSVLNRISAGSLKHRSRNDESILDFEISAFLTHEIEGGGGCSLDVGSVRRPESVVEKSEAGNFAGKLWGALKIDVVVVEISMRSFVHCTPPVHHSLFVPMIITSDSE